MSDTYSIIKTDGKTNNVVKAKHL